MTLGPGILARAVSAATFFLRLLPPSCVTVTSSRTFSDSPTLGWAQGVPSPTLCCCSVSKSHLTLCDPMDCSLPGFPFLHYLPEFAQTLVHWVSDAIQSSHPVSPPSPLALNFSQHQGLFQRINSLHQVAKVLQLQLQHQSFQILKLELLSWFGWVANPPPPVGPRPPKF